jgi:hypothetical protein
MSGIGLVATSMKSGLIFPMGGRGGDGVPAMVLVIRCATMYITAVCVNTPLLVSDVFVVASIPVMTACERR